MIILLILQAFPAKCTGRIALVLGDMFSSIEAGDMFMSSKSTSARTGVAPASNTALAVATKVRSGIII